MDNILYCTFIYLCSNIEYDMNCVCVAINDDERWEYLILMQCIRGGGVYFLNQGAMP